MAEGPTRPRRPAWRHVEAGALAPLIPGLRALEAGIHYPLDGGADGGDAFTIDHGADYAAFYRGLGEAHFIVSRADGGSGRVVASIAGALRPVRVGDELISAAYIGDLKAEAAFRGTGIARSLAWAVLGMTRQHRFRQWRLVYFAAMRGARGDVSRSLRGANPGRLLRPTARLSLYFVEPASLVGLTERAGRDCPPNPAGRGLDLSPGVTADRETTAGRKDLRLVSTGAPWPLVHLPRGPSGWGQSLGVYLERCAAAPWNPGEQACFGLDERLTDHLGWLAAAGLHPGATCTIHTLPWPTRPRLLSDVTFCHLATSEI